MMQLVRRFRTPILVGIGTLVGVIVINLAVISPEGSSLSSLQARQHQLASQQTHLQTQLVLLKREKAHMSAACSTLTNDITQIPGTPDVDDFFRQVTALAVASGDPNTPSISVTEATTGASGGVTPVAVTFTLAGTYGQMNAFVHGLTSFPRLFTVSSIAIAGGPAATAGGAIDPNTPNYTLTLAGDIYYSVGRSNVCSGAGGTGATTTASH
jgi:Tfp pilus assembly protein PilO